MRLEYEHEGKKKVKFVFFSWVGKDMSAEHKERMHGHRHIVKEVLKVKKTKKHNSNLYQNILHCNWAFCYYI